MSLVLDRLVLLADGFDQVGLFHVSNAIDGIIQKMAAKKKKKQPPKKWWKKMEKEIKKGNPDYSEERVDDTIGHIWYHLLSEKKRKSIRRRDG